MIRSRLINFYWLSFSFSAFMLVSSADIPASDVIAITSPSDGSVVTGSPLTISGTSSKPNFKVRLTINTTIIGSTVTNGSGNWNFSLSRLDDGHYTITADLMSSGFEILASTINSFTVQNPATIEISTPLDGDVVFTSPSIVQGTSTAPLEQIQLVLDGSPVATTTADSKGDWSSTYSITSNGSHTLTANVIVSGSPVATTSVSYSSAVPIIYPAGISQLRIIDGVVPTTGSGSGNGYIYSVSGSIITISFTPAFTSAPSVMATGMRTAGSSTVTLASVSATAVNIGFSTGTQNVHFTAVALS